MSDLWNIAFLIIPLIAMIQISIQSGNMINYTDQILHISIYLEHYLQIFEYNIYIYAILNSIFLAFCTTIICIILSYPTAYYIRLIKSQQMKLLCKLLIIVPCWLPFLIRIFAWIYIIDYLEIEYSNYTILLGGVSCFLPFSILSIQNLIDQIEDNIIEAAYDLGAKPLTVLLKIILPLTYNGIFNIAGFVFIPMLAEYFITSLMGGGFSIVIGRIIHNAIIHNRFGFAAAYIIFILLLISPYIFLYRKYTK